jgi:hypothetical protein
MLATVFFGVCASTFDTFDTILHISPAHDGSVAVRSEQDYELLGLTSVFSPPPPIDGRLRPLVLSRPRSACAPIESVSVGAAVLVERGECTFDTKVLAVERAGGAVAIVINSDDEPVHMDMHADVRVRPTIPALMVNATHGGRLRRLVGTRSDTAGVQLAPPPAVTFARYEMEEDEEAVTLTEGALLFVAILGLGLGLSSDAAARRTEWLHGGPATRTLLSALDLLGRLLLAATFAEDGVRVLMRWGPQLRVLSLAYGTSAKALLGIRLTLALSTAVQLSCALLLVLNRLVASACALLLAWLCVQPFIFQQLATPDFLTASAAVGGGLLFLAAHQFATPTGSERARGMASGSSGGAVLAKASCSLIGRLLLVFLFVYEAFEPLHQTVTHHHRAPDGSRLYSLAAAVDTLVLLLGGTLCLRVVLGLQPRLSVRRAAARQLPATPPPLPLSPSLALSRALSPLSCAPASAARPPHQSPGPTRARCTRLRSPRPSRPHARSERARALTR